MVTFQSKRVDNRNKAVRSIEKAIDHEFNNPGDRMMLKLFMENYDNDDIAHFAGIKRETLTQVLLTCGHRLERRLGYSLVELRAICMGWKLSWN